MASESSVTAILKGWGEGNEDALRSLIPLVYAELRRVAARHLRNERRDHTLQTTALVHEVYLKLVDQRRVQWRDKAHFMAVAARLMRRVLVDHARRRKYQKRGGGARPITLSEAVTSLGTAAPDLIELDDALTDLAELDREQSQIVELRFFGGLTEEEIAEAMTLSVATVNRRWRMARAWLYQSLTSSADEGALARW